ncbi:sulfotransferase [Okeania sp. SIO2B3]|uniref:sulfotransferase n=1 Tax=Okeania sp. SIO2B3 TaxID=2607784 RepID=UPI0013BEE127|nr:sulfotransferase [Okeania sp. SIO2B3]NET43127.1 hypothetical protein [Okeania sp. SIO2B3]
MFQDNVSPVNLIYILSSGHSGSTLTDLLLGSHSCVESVGEIFKLSSYLSDSSNIPNKNRICTCGTLIDHCQYWQSVKTKLSPSVIKKINVFGDNFTKHNYQLIKTILDISGKSIFVDSSKSIPRLENFLRSNLFVIQIIHLIRDGRAVGFSSKSKYQRILSELEEVNQNLFLRIKYKLLDRKYKKYNFYSTIRDWSYFNLKCHKKFGHLPNYHLLRYEDLVSSPENTINEILQKWNLIFEPSQLEFYKFKHHNISGNRMRMKPNQTIKQDIKYLEKLSFWEWWIGTVLAKNELEYFGYSLKRY